MWIVFYLLHQGIFVPAAKCWPLNLGTRTGHLALLCWLFVYITTRYSRLLDIETTFCCVLLEIGLTWIFMPPCWIHVIIHVISHYIQLHSTVSPVELLVVICQCFWVITDPLTYRNKLLKSWHVREKWFVFWRKNYKLVVNSIVNKKWPLTRLCHVKKCSFFTVLKLAFAQFHGY